ncbi:PIN domain-containing protein [Mycolicibacterium sp. ND9-15]|uniref:PIN domain-containing protein n=1 Tax=Mycolicibacterium sp. ND9-15 TaxID=3042320 RepID=UPI002DDABD4A|nr:PIN domain-containing protein [Mycolicibacterium sp. ND9-15]WSE58613.1 PIN domain-containing protein [Mycolicibacterium sp. ND9-15]
MDSGSLGGAARVILFADPDWMVPRTALWRCSARSAVMRLRSWSPEPRRPSSRMLLSAEVRYGLSDEWSLTTVWASHHSLSVYDAPYVALAVRYAVPLVTFDARLARAAGALGADVVVPDEG